MFLTAADVANLTAVDQFGIGMRLDTFNGGSEHLETVAAANAETIFTALQQIPGGPEATVRDSGGNVLRVLSPLHTSSYPDLGEYVRSMSGQAITLRTAYFGKPFTTSSYSGSFAADGSIELKGTTNPAEAAPETISFDGQQLIESIYTGAGTPNTAEGAIRRDLLAGFSTGLWGGKYGNDALSFCSNPMTTVQGSWCPDGFNQPAFGAARTSQPPFPTCEQYAAVINQFSDAYGNPYSDASKKVTVSLDQPVDGGEVDALQLTVLPDSGSSQPVASGDPNCGAGSAAPQPVSRAKVHFRFFKRAKVRRGHARVARVACGEPCGRIKAFGRQGHRIVGRQLVKKAGRKHLVVLQLNKVGKKRLARRGKLRLRLDLWVKPDGQPASRAHHALILRRG